MKVRVTKPGFYNRLWSPGEVFEIESEEMFSERWMEKVDPPKKRGRPRKEVKKDEPGHVLGSEDADSVVAGSGRSDDSD